MRRGSDIAGNDAFASFMGSGSGSGAVADTGVGTTRGATAILRALLSAIRGAMAGGFRTAGAVAYAVNKYTVPADSAAMQPPVTARYEMARIIPRMAVQCKRARSVPRRRLRGRPQVSESCAGRVADRPKDAERKGLQRRGPPLSGLCKAAMGASNDAFGRWQ